MSTETHDLKVAGPEDKEEVMGFIQQFFFESHMPSFFKPDNLERVVDSFLFSPNNQNIIILAPRKGLIAATATVNQFDGRVLVHENVWFVDHPYRNTKVGLSLFQALESWSKHIGANHVVMVGFDKKTSDFYKSQGYSFLETSMIKEL